VPIIGIMEEGECTVSLLGLNLARYELEFPFWLTSFVSNIREPQRWLSPRTRVLRPGGTFSNLGDCRSNLVDGPYF
jgi:hypothetical protein